MKRFSKLHERAAVLKGGEATLESLIAKPKSKASLARIPDDRWLSAMAKSVFRAGFNWKVVENKWPDIEAAYSGFDPHMVAFQPDDDLDILVKDPRVIRQWRKSRDVTAALRREKVFDGTPTSKTSLRQIQDALNEWVADGGKSLTRVSRVLAFSLD